MKKLSVLFLILLLSLCIGCKTKNYKGNIYNINYICNNEVLNFDINSYISGEELELPKIDRPGFLGWFDNKELSGEKIEKIFSNDYGNKIYYALIDESLELFGIEYYYGDEKLDYSPNNYRFGDSFELPEAKDIDDKIFMGWFLDKTYNNKITEIKSNDLGDKKLYAYYKDEYELFIDDKDYSKTKRLEDAISLVNNGDGITKGLPSTGDVNVLVIPVEFNDYLASNDMKENITKAMFGESIETGWESLSSYYKKSSYGKININGYVTDVYSTGKMSTYYEDLLDPTYDILKEALIYFDPIINYNDFDSNDDGYIDSIYLIYTAPIDYDNDESIWWAFTDEYITEKSEYYDDVEADFYMFAGYDFFFETPECGEKLIFNTETYIHETGHLLGLDDYYDYDMSDRNNKGGLGGADMMDCNVGDHNPYSKAILNWINPIVFETSSDISKCKIYLDSFVDSGDSLLITKEFKDSFFDEYYLVCLYTPEGLNEFEAGNSGLFSKNGVIIYHVSSLLTTKSVDCVWDITGNNNASSKTKLIKIIEADGKNDIDKEMYSTDEDLFIMGDVISNLKWNDGTSIGISIEVKNIENNQVELRIIK